MDDDRVRRHTRDTSGSPLAPNPRQVHFGSDAPAARYYSSRIYTEPTTNSHRGRGDDDDWYYGEAPRRGPRSPTNYYSDYDAPTQRIERSITRTVQYRDQDEFTTKVEAYRLPVAPVVQAASYMDDISSLVDLDTTQAALAKPSDALHIYESHYTGDGVMEGSHSATLTVRHDAKGKSSSAFRWLHVQQDTMSLDEFSAQIMQLPALSETHRSAIARLLFEVRKTYSKPVWTSKNATVRQMTPGFRQTTLRPESSTSSKHMSAQSSVKWFCIPYLSLRKYSGLDAPADPGTYPTATLLQSSYARIAEKRDMAQVVRQIGIGSERSCLHIPQLWCIVVAESLLLTCGTMSEQELRGDMPAEIGSSIPIHKTVTIISEPPREVTAKESNDVRILVRYGGATLWVVPLQDCPTFFNLVGRFREFWPNVVHFRYRGDRVTKESWKNRVIRDARFTKRDITVALEISPPVSTSDYSILDSETLGVRHVPPKAFEAEKAPEAGEDGAGTRSTTMASDTPSDRRFHVFSWEAKDQAPEDVRRGVQSHLADIENLFMSNSNAPWTRKYTKADSSMQWDVYEIVKNRQDEPSSEDDDDVLDDAKSDSIKLYNVAKIMYDFFLPAHIVSKVSSKYWGAIKMLVSDVDKDSDSDEGRYGRRHRRPNNTSTVLTGLKRHIPQINAFHEILMNVPEDVAAGLVVPRELVQAWILLIMALIRAVADDYYGWEEQLDKSMDKLQAGMSQMVASLHGPHLGSSALVLPMDLLSLMLPRLLSDSNGHHPGYSQIYSSYLQELEAEIMGMKSDISYQNRINLAQQEISVIRKTIESQKSIIRQIMSAECRQTQGDEILRTGHDEAKALDNDTAPRPVIERTRGFHDGDRNPLRDDRDISRFSPTDPRGLRIMLLRECANLLRGTAQDFTEYEFQAGSLEQMNMNKVSITKDRQEQLLYAFTVVTIIFLPMDTVSSIFGMNTADVRDMELTQWAFWAAAIPTGILVILAALWMVGAYGELAAWLGKKFRADDGLVLEDRPPPYQRVVGEGLLSSRRGDGRTAPVAVAARVQDRYSGDWDEPYDGRVSRRTGYRVVER